MRNVWIIAQRELGAYFGTPLAYIFVVIFVALTGAFAFFIGNFFERGQADLQAFFTYHPWLYLLLVPAIGGTALVAALVVFQPYRMQRLLTFLNPWDHALDSGYQLTQALIAFGRGEWFGLAVRSQFRTLILQAENGPHRLKMDWDGAPAGLDEWVRVSIASPLMQPSPYSRRVGIRIVTFEACSGFTHVTAHRIAQPPKATFVTRLRPMQLPA